VYADYTIQFDIARQAMLAAAANSGCASGDSACWLGFRDSWISGGEVALQTYKGPDPSVFAQPSSTGIYRLNPDNPYQITDTINSYLNLDQNTSITYDIRTRFSFDGDEIPFIGGDYGSFTATLDATFVEEFTVTPDPTSDERVNMAGQLGRNEALQDGGSPRWKGSAGLRWAYGDHTARLTARYHHHVKDYNVPAFTCITTLSNASCRVDSMVVYDLFYQYRFQDLMGLQGETTLSLTVNNLFDNLPDPQESSITPFTSSLDRNNWGRYYNLRLQHTF
jgi:hypothetical protein